jgi:27-O-demethylrifamycin SV methyltransferase
VNADHEPAAHYDHVTRAWGLLLGADLHYGVYETGEESLPTATGALTALMAETADLRPGLRVLDVGCGTGTPACNLAEEFDVRVVGITTSAVGVEAATRQAAERGLSDQVSFELRDGTDNGFDSETFDRVWVLESSHLMPRRDALVNECARVLTPGGRMTLCDLVRHREIPFRELRERTAEFATLRAAFGEARMEPLATYLEFAQAAGLTIDRSQDLTEQTLPTFDHWRQNAAAHAAEVIEAIGQQGLDDFVRSTEILESLWRDGTLGYGMFAAVR